MSAIRCLFRGPVAPVGLLPVDHVPPRLYVLRAPVLVLEVVGVLPHVQPYNRRLALHQGAILVGRLLYAKRPVGGGYEPHPPRPEHAARRPRGGPPLLEVLEGAEIPL